MLLKKVLPAILLVVFTGCAQATPAPQNALGQPSVFGAASVTPPCSATEAVCLFPSDTPTPQATPTATFTPSPAPSVTPTPQPVVLVGAGDIAICGQTGQEDTAALIQSIPGAAVFTAGDNSNEQGTLGQYQNCFDPSWGQFKDRIRPAPGNHDYGNDEAADYFTYFGAAAGEAGKGYYSYDLGGWHIVALNSNCAFVGGCNAGSPQEQWLRADLAAHPAACTLAYWHHPLFSSGFHEGLPALGDLWRALADSGAEIVLNGHDHHYERFAPQDAGGQADPAGIREFIVGTGGAGQRGLSGAPIANSEKTIVGTFGVLKLTLYPDRYEWEYIPTDPDAPRDSGSAACH